MISNERALRTDLLTLDRSRSEPLYRQIVQRLRDAIEQGLLRPGARVASARSLASELGVARSTVELAYGQLAGEGYLLARGQAGTVISPRLPPRAPRRAARGSTPGPLTLAPVGPPPPFQLGIPALDAFPRKLWARLATRRVRATTIADMNYGDPAGYAPLREAIATYLRVSRGVACSPAQVVVTAGHRASLALVSRALLAPHDGAWVEEPGYPPTREVLQGAGLRVVSVPVDTQGLRVADGLRRAAGAKLAVVTPSHQSPLGYSMSMARRLELLAWAQDAKAWIVEDDYDGEYRYAGHPLPALKSLDAQDRVLYAGTFSKVLHPGLALAYLVVPEPLVERCTRAAGVASNGCPQLAQAIVCDFLQEGHFARHIKKMRLLYARRRAMLAAELQKAFGEAVQVELRGGGMHLIARFGGLGSDTALSRRAQGAGLHCRALSERYAGKPALEGLLMGFTNIASQAEVRQLVGRLRNALVVG
ncbi:MocR-like pyridoxine biosynthesis transcription factor PdxR [Variovorax sp. PBS-H4]|uniref:MocR-like pyridoxine biosynthesis transcription factor PdxR n=1 Tax=Variovorax sp. PBS-H4 TaxID=434008 RepID=UPI0013A532E4|nr:PLP-dependent aminotransferase family protein [Variovorax sp. PBS-H4]